jgi:hypothetical protein
MIFCDKLDNTLRVIGLKDHFYTNYDPLIEKNGGVE